MNPIERRLPHDPKCAKCDEQIHLLFDEESGAWYCAQHWDEMLADRARAADGDPDD